MKSNLATLVAMLAVAAAVVGIPVVAGATDYNHMHLTAPDAKAAGPDTMFFAVLTAWRGPRGVEASPTSAVFEPVADNTWTTSDPSCTTSRAQWTSAAGSHTPYMTCFVLYG